MEKYDPKTLEPKWQQVWAETNLYAAKDADPRPKFYMLTEFPYPSAAGLHAGHVREYTIGDVIARYQRMMGHNTLYPMGWDAFGLPTENYAIKMKIKPQDATRDNVATFRQQLQSLGLGIDWDREVNTSDPSYYKWTQWLFLQFLKAGLAYQAEIPINWCPKEKTGLANEEVVNGLHERCGTPVEKKTLKQWMLKITAYADRLVEGLKTVDYPPRIADQQINWIGRSEGAEIDFAVEGHTPFRRVVLLHGKDVTPRDKWYPWLGQQLEAAGLKYQGLELTDDEQPKLAEWIKQLEASNPDESTVLVGHSRGGVAILRWLEQAGPGVKVGRVVLVATSRGDKHDKAGGEDFFAGDYDFAKIRQHADDFVVIHSRDDEWVPFAHGEYIAKGLGAKFIALDGKHHFGNNTPEVPEILLHVLSPDVITAYTTRPDTLGGATFLVLAPEHQAVQRITTEQQRAAVEKYVKQAQRETELERQEEERPKTGVFTGAYAENPITKAKIPVWVADYVLAGYGTGAIMAVPAHDDRDLAFAQAMNKLQGLDREPHYFDPDLPPKPGLAFQPREAAIVIVKHPHDNTYLTEHLVTWDNDVHSFVMGGIKPGEDAMAAAKRELLEETGYDHIGAIYEIGSPYTVDFYHEGKQANRRAHVHPVVVELADLHQQPVSESEQKKHQLIWLPGDEALRLQAGEGARKVFTNYQSGQTQAPIKIIPVIEPDVVRDDAKDFKEFVRKRKIVATVENDKGEILSINWGPKLGGRLTVGGTIEGDETPDATALREVAEETGYHDLEVLEVAPESYHYKYYAHSKQRACQADVNFVHIRLRSDKRHEQHLEDNEKGHFKVEWVSREQVEREITDPLHRFALDKFIFGRPYTGYGPLINSKEFNGLAGTEAKRAVTKWLYGQGLGRGATKYRLRDWIFSRQHYWGEPIPVIHCPKDGAVPVPDDQLPVTLPEVEHYEPTDTGESPLAAITDWVNTTCPQCGGQALRETDTMPNWAGSSWYYARYADPHNDRAFADPEKLKYWLPVNLYLGGMEHTTLHLLYSRFWHQFLHDQGLMPTPEPYAARRGQGIVLASDGRKMSKSIGNVINPTDIIARYGADAFRLYIMFMAPYDETTPWSDERLNGVSRFVYRVWSLATGLIANRTPSAGAENTGELTIAVDRATHKTLKKVHDDLAGMRFNTYVSTLMEYVNFLNEPNTRAALTDPANADLAQRTVRALILMLAPGAPHITEELWHQLGEEGSVHTAGWPAYDPELIKDDLVTVVVQVNGKVRGQVAVPADTSEADIINLATAEPRVAAHLDGMKITNTVVVPRRLVNFVVK